MLKVSLYWNVTGRFLGIELPPGEFLSKSDHEPFTLSEYYRMHRLLDDPMSPLAAYSFKKLVPSSGGLFQGSELNDGLSLEVDAVTAAPSPSLEAYVFQAAENHTKS